MSLNNLSSPTPSSHSYNTRASRHGVRESYYNASEESESNNGNDEDSDDEWLTIADDYHSDSDTSSVTVGIQALCLNELTRKKTNNFYDNLPDCRVRKSENEGEMEAKNLNSLRPSEVPTEEEELRQMIGKSIIQMNPNVTWDDIAGLDAAKSILKKAVVLPTRFPNIFVGKRQPYKAILLYGPPGTGKTYLAKAVASELSRCTFFNISASDLMSKWVGESEKLTKNLFAMARDSATCKSVIFIDEIDSLCTNRDNGEL